MKFAVPFDYSMHNLLLRYYVAESGLDPDKDISIRVVPPPEMVANLRAENIDGYLAPEPFNQRVSWRSSKHLEEIERILFDLPRGRELCADLGFAAGVNYAVR
jgi:nitrate/nitrite transport system substrate-binding protein